MSDVVCIDCRVTKPDIDFPMWNGVVQPRCKACQKVRNQQYRAARKGQPVPITPKATLASAHLEQEATLTAPTNVAPQSTFHASQTLIDVVSAVMAGTADGSPSDNLMFLGPSGCGKTTSAEYIAQMLGLDFVKVDAAAMTDPESWFGTREVIAVDGTSVTTYRPSEFVEAIQRPCVLLLDEINRVRDEHRNIILPLTDLTRRVTNPLTGEVVRRHPQCLIIMSGNRGLQFTGTYAVDPALMTRAYILEFSYLPDKEEAQVVLERYPGLDPRVASTLVRLANETRQRAAADPDFIGVSTREVLATAKLIHNGLNPDLAVSVAILNVASDEGGEGSVRSEIAKLWVGVRPLMYGEQN
jgi:MoxR-like ATPases